MDWFLKSLILPAAYKKQIKELDVAPILILSIGNKYPKEI
jgi:hypothetical protein